MEELDEDNEKLKKNRARALYNKCCARLTFFETINFMSIILVTLSLLIKMIYDI
jgi:hypothetical protein